MTARPARAPISQAQPPDSELARASSHLRERLKKIYDRLPSDLETNIQGLLGDYWRAEHDFRESLDACSAVLRWMTPGHDRVNSSELVHVDEARQNLTSANNNILPQVHEQSRIKTQVLGEMRGAWERAIGDLACKTMQASGFVWTTEQQDMLHWFLESKLVMPASLLRPKMEGKDMEQVFSHVELAESAEDVSVSPLSQNRSVIARLKPVLGIWEASELFESLADMPFQYENGTLILTHQRRGVLARIQCSSAKPAVRAPRKDAHQRTR